MRSKECQECLAVVLEDTLSANQQKISDTEKQRNRFSPDSQQWLVLNAAITKAVKAADSFIENSLIPATNGCSHCPLVDRYHHS